MKRLREGGRRMKHLLVSLILVAASAVTVPLAAGEGDFASPQGMLEAGGAIITGGRIGEGLFYVVVRISAGEGVARELQVWDSASPAAPVRRMSLPDRILVQSVAALDARTAVYALAAVDGPGAVVVADIDTGETKASAEASMVGPLAVGSSGGVPVVAWAEADTAALHDGREIWRLRVMDPASGELKNDIEFHNAPISQIAWFMTDLCLSRDCSKALVVVASGRFARLYLVDLAKDAAVWERSFLDGGVRGVGWSADGATIFVGRDLMAVSSADDGTTKGGKWDLVCGRVSVWDAASGEAFCERPSVFPSAVLGVSPDGRLLAVSDVDKGAVSIIDLHQMRTAETINVSDQPVHVFFFSDDATAFWAAAGSNEQPGTVLRCFRIGETAPTE